MKNGAQPVAPNLADAAIRREVWELRLYVAGQSPKSVAAFSNLKKICEEHLAGRYRIEVIDLMEHPQLAAGDQIIAIPTLVRKLPEPLRKIVGDLRDTERTLVGLYGDRLVATVALIRAIGGGWRASDLPPDPGARN